MDRVAPGERRSAGLLISRLKVRFLPRSPRKQNSCALIAFRAPACLTDHGSRPASILSASRFDWAAALSAPVLIECVILALNRRRCPLTDAAARYTESRAGQLRHLPARAGGAVQQGHLRHTVPAGRGDRSVAVVDVRAARRNALLCGRAIIRGFGAVALSAPPMSEQRAGSRKWPLSSSPRSPLVP
jgi:hypothetical protein